jgi:secreted PhoX family phosphatase
VQLDDEHAVDNEGCIFQITDKDSADEVAGNSNALQYEGETGTIYNYAEDSADFAEDSEDLDIYSDCKEQAELLFDEESRIEIERAEEELFQCEVEELVRKQIEQSEL